MLVTLIQLKTNQSRGPASLVIEFLGNALLSVLRQYEQYIVLLLSHPSIIDDLTLFLPIDASTSALRYFY